jgi:hypothetical protein
MTLKEIELLDKETLTPAEVASCTGFDRQYLTIEAREHPENLGFPVIVVGHRTKIPKEAFLKFMRGEKVSGGFNYE